MNIWQIDFKIQGSPEIILKVYGDLKKTSILFTDIKYNKSSLEGSFDVNNCNHFDQLMNTLVEFKDIKASVDYYCPFSVFAYDAHETAFDNPDNLDPTEFHALTVDNRAVSSRFDSNEEKIKYIKESFGIPDVKDNTPTKSVASEITGKDLEIDYFSDYRLPKVKQGLKHSR